MKFIQILITFVMTKCIDTMTSSSISQSPVNLLPTVSTLLPSSSSASRTPGVNFAQSSYATDLKSQTISETQNFNHPSTSVIERSSSVSTTVSIIVSTIVSTIIDKKQQTATTQLKYLSPTSTLTNRASASKSGDGGISSVISRSIAMVSASTSHGSVSINPSSATVSVAMNSSAVVTTTTTTTTLKPEVAPQNCNEVKNEFCQNGGFCVNKTISDDKMKPTCLCASDYYGDNCDKEITPPIYKQLTYAFGGATGFLLLVVIVLICCRCQNRKKGKGELPYSEELDNFSVSNKRASAVFPSSKPQTINVVSYENNGIGMYGD